MKRPLPDNVHLLTLEQWDAGTVLLRLEHFYAKDEDPVLSQPAKVQLKVCAVCWSISFTLIIIRRSHKVIWEDAALHRILLYVTLCHPLPPNLPLIVGGGI